MSQATHAEPTEIRVLTMIDLALGFSAFTDDPKRQLALRMDAPSFSYLYIYIFGDYIYIYIIVSRSSLTTILPMSHHHPDPVMHHL